MGQYYLWFKALHVISIICWMAAMFYLPRLYIYHTSATSGSELDLTLQLMERRLLRIIMTPAMISSYIFGITCAYIYGFEALGGWFHIKLTAVLIMTVIHGLLAKWRKEFAEGKNTRSAGFYRLINEIPPILMVIAVLMVIIKPFD